MHFVYAIWRLSVALVIIAFVAGCASSDKKNVAGTGELFEVLSQEESRTALEAIVESELRREFRQQGEENARFVSKRPYFFNEYFVFDEGPEVYELQFTEKESRTTPLTAELIVSKHRFSTRMNKKRDVARADRSFLRGRGVERVSYELSNGRWFRVGSLFVSDATEEFVDGEWKQIEESSSRFESFEEEESKSFWQRLAFWR